MRVRHVRNAREILNHSEDLRAFGGENCLADDAHRHKVSWINIRHVRWHDAIATIGHAHDLAAQVQAFAAILIANQHVCCGDRTGLFTDNLIAGLYFTVAGRHAIERYDQFHWDLLSELGHAIDRQGDGRICPDDGQILWCAGKHRLAVAQIHRHRGAIGSVITVFTEADVQRAADLVRDCAITVFDKDDAIERNFVFHALHLGIVKLYTDAGHGQRVARRDCIVIR